MNSNKINMFTIFWLKEFEGKL